LPDFKALGESLWKIGAISQFDAFDYAKPVQPPFELEKSDLEDADEWRSQYLLPERDNSAMTLAQLSTYPISEPSNDPSNVEPRPKQASDQRIPVAGRTKPISSTVSRAAKPSIIHSNVKRESLTPITSSAATPGARQTRSMIVPRSMKSALVPQRMTRTMTRAASTARADSSPKATRGKADPPQSRPGVEKATVGRSTVTRSKVRAKGDSCLDLEDVVMDLMRPQARIWDNDISVQLWD